MLHMNSVVENSLTVECYKLYRNKSILYEFLMRSYYWHHLHEDCCPSLCHNILVVEPLSLHHLYFDLVKLHVILYWTTYLFIASSRLILFHWLCLWIPRMVLAFRTTQLLLGLIQWVEMHRAITRDWSHNNISLNLRSNDWTD